MSSLSGYALIFALAVSLAIYGGEKAVHGIKALRHRHQHPVAVAAPLN